MTVRTQNTAANFKFHLIPTLYGDCLVKEESMSTRPENGEIIKDMDIPQVRATASARGLKYRGEREMVLAIIIPEANAWKPMTEREAIMSGTAARITTVPTLPDAPSIMLPSRTSPPLCSMEYVKNPAEMNSRI